MTKLEWFQNLWRDMTPKERESIIMSLISDYKEQFIKTVNGMWRRYCEEKQGSEK